MVKLISIKCPECGANLEIEEERKTAFCTYCGAKLLIHNENEHIFRNVDEAEILHAQNEKYKLETDRIAMTQNLVDEKKDTIIMIIALLAIIVIFVIATLMRVSGSEELKDISLLLILVDFMGLTIYMVFIVTIFDNKSKNKNKPGYIKFPEGVDYIHGFRTKIHYLSAERALQVSGFKDIQSINLFDLKPNNTKREFCVSKITIDGNEIDDFEASYNANSKIIIYYHGLPE